jgi:hypothetical protein
MKKQVIYLANEERKVILCAKVIPCTWGEKCNRLHMRGERSYLAHEKRKVISCTWGEKCHTLHMRREMSYLAQEERNVIDCTWGEKGHILHMRRERSYLAHEKRIVIPCILENLSHSLRLKRGNIYLGDVDRKDIPCTLGEEVIPCRCGQERHTLHMRRGRSWSRKDSRRRETWQSAHQLLLSDFNLSIMAIHWFLSNKTEAQKTQNFVKKSSLLAQRRIFRKKQS